MDVSPVELFPLAVGNVSTVIALKCISGLTAGCVRGCIYTHIVVPFVYANVKLNASKNSSITEPYLDLIPLKRITHSLK